MAMFVLARKVVERPVVVFNFPKYKKKKEEKIYRLKPLLDEGQAFGYVCTRSKGG